MIEKKPILIIYGPTASGKSALALRIAKELASNTSLCGTIINADCKQIYKEAPIITAQPSDLKNISHKLYGHISIWEDEYFMSQWLEEIIVQIKKSFIEKKIPIVVGGNWLYMDALINGIHQIPKITDDTRYKNIDKHELYLQLRKIDQEYALKINKNDAQRIIRAIHIKTETGKSILDWHKSEKIRHFNENQFIQINVSPIRSSLYQNIDKRFISMIDDGAIDEIKKTNINIDQDGKCYKYDGKNNNEIRNQKILKIHGLQHIIRYMNNMINIDQMILLSQTDTRHYAKRQYTWMNNKQLALNNMTINNNETVEEMEKILQLLSNYIN